MGTRSTIGLEYPDGTVRGIYCHWDGYPDNNGKILVEHYTTPEKISTPFSISKKVVILLTCTKKGC